MVDPFVYEMHMHTHTHTTSVEPSNVNHWPSYVCQSSCLVRPVWSWQHRARWSRLYAAGCCRSSDTDRPRYTN